MDPDATYATLRLAVERLAARPDVSGNDETVVETWRALDGWLARGGYKPAAWSMHDRSADLVNAVDDVQRELNRLATLVDGLGRARPDDRNVDTK